MKETLTAAPVTEARFWTISGVCRCTPPTPYGLMLPITSDPSRLGLSDFPAPEVPLAATMTICAGSMRPDATAGSSANVDAVG